MKDASWRILHTADNILMDKLVSKNNMLEIKELSGKTLLCIYTFQILKIKDIKILYQKEKG